MSREACLSKVQNAKRVVIKVGTQLLTDPDSHEGVNHRMIEKIRSEILFLRHRGVEVMLVTSGAVGMGREVLRRFKRSSGQDATIARKQALSAIGQSKLMSIYAEVFRQAEIPVAQLLLTARGFRDRRAYLNVGHTLQELVSLEALAIVNENDTVSTDELQFGDNDMLSAACTSLFRADLLVILTSVPGFLVDGKVVPYLARVGDAEMAHASGPAGPGSGGMITKLRAGQLCSMSGEMLAILPGTHPSPVQALFGGEEIGTLIGGGETKRMGARKRWLLYTRTQGGVVVDAGAKRALLERGSSLLPVGIIESRGHFLTGDVIDILDEEGRVLGRGIVNYSYRELLPATGKGSGEIRDMRLLTRAREVIHRNNMILEQY